MIKIALCDFGGTGLDNTALGACAAAIDTQIKAQFSLSPPFGWGVNVDYVRAASGQGDIKPEEWICGFFEHADAPGALGYHDRTSAGKPVMKYFPLLDKKDNSPWQVTADHEILETILDPELSLCFQAPDGGIWAGEDCDPVEQDFYLINGVPLSNFVLPAWFQPPRDRAGARYDYLGLCRAPFEIRAGGYAQVWNPRVGWTQVLHHKDAPRSYRQNVVGRGMRRAVEYTP